MAATAWTMLRQVRPSILFVKLMWRFGALHDASTVTAPKAVFSVLNSPPGVSAWFLSFCPANQRGEG
jgi:hypothetical protein